MEFCSVPTAAIIIIGNEILSGQVHDLNFPFFVKTLASIGIVIKKCEIIPDEEEVITQSIRALKNQYTYIFTTGGIGPTHDDVTMPAVSKAFDRPLIRNQDIVKAFEEKYPLEEEYSQARLRMADVPQGATLLFSDLCIAPGVCLENVYVLPGVPFIMQNMLIKLLPFLQKGPISYQNQVLCQIPESKIASALDILQKKYSSIQIGSYPSCEPLEEMKTLIIFKGYEQNLLNQCVQGFLDYLTDHSLPFYTIS